MTMLAVSTSPQNLSSGDSETASLNRRAELLRMPWHIQLALEGRVFTAGAGTITTPITFTSTTVVDVTLPDFLLRVPTGVVIVPLYAHIIYEATGGTLTEGVMSRTDTDPGNGTSSAADRLAVNLKTRGVNSSCTVRQLVTVTPTFINNTEFWRWGEPPDLDATVSGESGFTWDYQRNANVPYIIGPATLNIASGTGTSSTGYITVVWAEFLTSEVQ